MSHEEYDEEIVMSATLNARVVDLDSNELVNHYGASTLKSEPQAQAMAISRMNAVLQTSIELPEILRLFYKEIQRVLAVDGITFEHKAYEFSHEQGDTAGHSSSYRVQTDSDFLGDLTLYRIIEAFNDEELSKLDRFISALVFPLRNGLRYREAVRASLTDGLTGAGNRISLDSVLDRELDQSSRYGNPLSILLLDLDHFKKVNDSFGHVVGDHVLKTVANTIQATSRSADLTFRYGGEEFVILLHKTDVAGAKISAERIRKTIEKLSIRCGDSLIPVTASIGCASLSHGETKDSLLKRADKALYMAKEKGRNRIMVAEPNLANA